MTKTAPAPPWARASASPRPGELGVTADDAAHSGSAAWSLSSAAGPVTRSQRPGYGPGYVFFRRPRVARRGPGAVVQCRPPDPWRLRAPADSPGPDSADDGRQQRKGNSDGNRRGTGRAVGPGRARLVQLQRADVHALL